MANYSKVDYEERACIICGSSFKPKKKDTIRCQTVECRKTRAKIRSAQWFEDNKEYAIDVARTWYINNPEIAMLVNAKRRAKKTKRDFNLESDDITIPEICPILQIPMVRKTRTTPTLDRFDNDKGYVKGNVWVVSKVANHMKSDASPEELRRFADWIIKTYPH